MSETREKKDPTIAGFPGATLEEPDGKTFDPSAPKKPTNLEIGIRKGGIVQIIMAVAISVILSVLITSVLITPRIATPLATYRADMAAISTSLNNLNTGLAEVEDSIPNMSEIVTSSDLAGFVDGEELEDLETIVSANSGKISEQQAKITSVETRIGVAEGKIAESSIESYLAGTFRKYILHAKSDKAGKFAAKISLVYLTPKAVGAVNATESEAREAFYSSWLNELDRNYVCELALVENGASHNWVVTQVTFYTKEFELVVGVEKELKCYFEGFKSAFEPDFSYVEIFPTLTTGAQEGDESEI